MGENLTTIIKPALEEKFQADWKRCRVILFSAPCGCGKTSAAEYLLRGKSCRVLDAAAADFMPESVPAACRTVMVDDLQNLTEPERQKALCELIRLRREAHFVLLGRGRVPGWLMPFQLAGIMATVESGDLLFDRDTSRRMLEARGVSVAPAEMSAIQRDFRGYPVALELLCRHMADGARYDGEILAQCKRELFVYYDEAVFRRFECPMRNLLMCLSPFEKFRLELARMVSGDPGAGELLGFLQRDTTMMLFDGLDTYRFWPIFREFLSWERSQSMTEAEVRTVYGRAALYYELGGELSDALRCYSLAGESAKISALLVKNAEAHPGVGHYRELQDYYFALPREEILRSPALMCGMSMLTALCLDYETSERWYGELRDYASRLRRSDADYRQVQGKLAYLDIALPQRGSAGLIGVIGSVFRVMADRQLHVPAFSVTSNLPSIMNGGKDFCEWSKKDDLLYAAMRTPVEAVLGPDGVGLADCAICESKFEKGENIAERLLTLMSRLGEIQARGTPDIEFAVMGLLARAQVAQGKAAAALESVESLRQKYVDSGQTRFLANIDALICRVKLRLGDDEAVQRWLETEAPKNEARLWAMWRYQYLTRVMAELSMGETEAPLLLLARLAPYCETCGRVMDGLHIRLLTALCRERAGGDWKSGMRDALDASLEYGFVWPVAQYGAAVLPLLRDCGWSGSSDFLDRLISAAREQAVFYPRFLKPPAAPAEPLSTAETQVLRLLCQGLGNQEIGDILGIKLSTVKTHVSHIFQKLGAKNRAEVKIAAEKLRLV